MPDLYLIVHKVRGEPAFDVAERITCPICEPIRQGLDISSPGCDACDHEGYWWIIPTSGHRAYPWWTKPLESCYVNNLEENPFQEAGIMPTDLRDHYETTRETRSTPSGGKPKVTEIDLADLGL